ncbi:MAG: DUF1552 domain-containing protein [Myxococcota bacterium]
MKKPASSRRQFLRGAAGFSLALPFLPSLLPSESAAQTGPQKRLVAFMSRQGQFEDNWFPSVTPENRIAENVYTMSLRDIPGAISRVVDDRFDVVRDKLTLMLGLDGMSRPFGHNTCFPLMGACPADDQGAPPVYPHTIDVILSESEKFYPTPVPEPVLRVNPNTGRPPSWARTTSFSYKNYERIPGQWDSRVVFNRLFGESDPDPDMSMGVSSRERQSLVIDRVKEDYDRLQGHSRLSGDDRERLDHFVTLLRDVQTRIDSVPIISCDGPVLRNESSHDEAYSNHIDIMVAALACGITKIGTLYCHHHASDGRDKGLHDVSHGNDAVSVARSLEYNTWIATRFLELLTKLDSVVEPDGTTLLDNSAALWGNDIAICDSHYQFRYPVLMAGSLQGALRTGVCIDYRSRPRRRWAGHEHLGRPYNQLLTTLMAGLGLEPGDWEMPGTPGFGDYSIIGDRYADGAYAEYVGRERDYLPHYYLG